MQLATGKWVSKALSVVADLAIPDLLKDGSRSIDELAASAGANPDSLYRLLRAATAVGVLTELPGRRFQNSEMSTLLRSDVPGSLRAMMRWLGEGSAWQAWGDLTYSVKTGRPAFDKVHGCQVFDYFAGHPESGQIFNDAMTSFTSVTGGAVADAYDFSGIKTLVDVGGGHGGLLVAIARKYPTIKGIVADRPDVAAGASALLASHGLQDRITASGVDFLQSVPAGGDA
jgi:C-methyltransferase